MKAIAQPQQTTATKDIGTDTEVSEFRITADDARISGKCPTVLCTVYDVSDTVPAVRYAVLIYFLLRAKKQV